MSNKIIQIIKEMRNFEKEELDIKIMKSFNCNNCRNNSENLKINKIESNVNRIINFLYIVDEHNKNIKNTLFGLKKSDIEWEVALQLSYIVIREKGTFREWINSYMIIFHGVRRCYVICPVCKKKYTYDIYKE